MLVLRPCNTETSPACSWPVKAPFGNGSLDLGLFLKKQCRKAANLPGEL